MCLSVSLFLSPRSVFSATLEQLSQPFVKKGEVLLEEGFDYFRLREEGLHGSTTYEKFDSEPEYYSLDTKFTFLLADNIECVFAFDQTLPENYKRYTYLAAESLGVVQDYRINSLSDYELQLGFRGESLEAYLSIGERSQKTNWRSSSHPNPPDYFSYMRMHHENIQAGVRYLSGAGHPTRAGGLSTLTHSLLDDGQLLIEAQLGYKQGQLRRNSFFYSGATLTPSNFYHRLKGHYLPGVTLRYGLRENLEAETGVTYVSPLEYMFEFREYRTTGTVLMEGRYRLEHHYEVPLKARYRPRDNLELIFSSDMAFIDQRLEYQVRSNTGVVTDYPRKELQYFATQPTLKLSYLLGAPASQGADTFSMLTKRLLRKGQLLCAVTYLKDVTSLDKNAANEALNIIDPYGIFLYPLDYFVVGSEYATFFTGNSSSSAADTYPQNYYQLQAALTYGVTDRLNAGLTVGYRSESSFHHFTVGNPRIGVASSSIYDLKNRFYLIKPYTFLDVAADWRVTENSIVSFLYHFVPSYKTHLQIADVPQEFQSEDQYAVLALKVKVLF